MKIGKFYQIFFKSTTWFTPKQIPNNFLIWFHFHKSHYQFGVPTVNMKIAILLILILAAIDIEGQLQEVISTWTFTLCADSKSILIFIFAYFSGYCLWLSKSECPGKRNMVQISPFWSKFQLDPNWSKIIQVSNVYLKFLP